MRPKRYRVQAAILLSCLSILAFSFADVNATDRDFSIDYADNKLTVKAQGVLLEDVLERLTQLAKFDVILTGPLQTPVTADFDALDLEEGVKRLIRGLSSVFYYDRGEPDGKGLKLTSVLILSNSDIRTTTAIRASGEADSPGQASASVSYEEVVEDIDRLAEAAWSQDRALYELADLAETEEDQERRLAAVEALGDVGNSEVEYTLFNKAMSDEDAEIRAAAVEALADVAGKDAKDFLVQALKDEDADVRTAAVEALAYSGGKEATDVLMQAMKDNDAQVRAAAVEALGDIGDKKAADALLGALEDADEEVKESAKAAIKEMGIKKKSPKQVKPEAAERAVDKING